MSFYIYELKYRLKNNDVNLKNKIKITIIFLIILAIFFIYFFASPFEVIKNKWEKRASDISSNTKVYAKNTTVNKNIYYSKDYIKPANGTITSNYGYRSGNFHTGIDVSCFTHRDNVLAVADGVVTFSGSQNGYGNCIEIKHEINGKTIYSFYAHLYCRNVSVGQKVSKGQVIAKEGGQPNVDPNIGNSTGHHLHFELRNASGYGNDIDPTFIFKD